MPNFRISRIESVFVLIMVSIFCNVIFYEIVKVKVFDKVWYIGQSDTLTTVKWRNDTTAASNTTSPEIKLCVKWSDTLKKAKERPIILRNENSEPLNLGPFDFLRQYRNPCFLRNVTNDNVTEESVACIPYFYIAGMPKSGTSDLWYKLQAHEHLCTRNGKEPMWFNRRRFSKRGFNDYLHHFNASTLCILKKTRNESYNTAITGEASVDYSFDNNNWRSFAGNENCDEPEVLNQHHLYNLYPGAKIIFMMRNPVERLYSDYIYEAQFVRYKPSLEGFHHHVMVNLVKHFLCRQEQSIRACAYNNTLENFQARIRVGMYHIFIKDWMDVFPAENILFIKFEDYTKNSTREMSRVLKHLGLEQFSDKKVRAIKKKIINSRSKRFQKMGDMFKETRVLLEKFYKPFNEKLAELLQDDKWLWHRDV